MRTHSNKLCSLGVDLHKSLDARIIPIELNSITLMSDTLLLQEKQVF